MSDHNNSKQQQQQSQQQQHQQDVSSPSATTAAASPGAKTVSSSSSYTSAANLDFSNPATPNSPTSNNEKNPANDAWNFSLSAVHSNIITAHFSSLLDLSGSVSGHYMVGAAVLAGTNTADSSCSPLAVSARATSTTGLAGRVQGKVASQLFASFRNNMAANNRINPNESTSSLAATHIISLFAFCF